MSELPSPHLSVLLVDDHLIVRRGLASLIGDEPDLSVVSEASSGEEAIAMASEHRPDVIVLDLRLRDMSGIEVAETLRGHKILMLSSFMQEEDVRRVFDAGIRGYLSKDKDSAELLKAIRAVGRGERYLPPEISLLLAKSEHSSHLTPRELEILKLVAQGKAYKEIREILASEPRLWDIVQAELEAIGKEHGDKRRSQIVGDLRLYQVADPQGVHPGYVSDRETVAGDEWPAVGEFTVQADGVRWVGPDTANFHHKSDIASAVVRPIHLFGAAELELKTTDGTAVRYTVTAPARTIEQALTAT